MFMCFMGNVTFLLANLERILQGVDLLDILRVCLIDQHAHHDSSVSRTDPLLGEGMTARAVIDRWGVLVLIDYLHRHESLAGIGQRNCHRTGVEVEHRSGIQRVAVRRSLSGGRLGPCLPASRQPQVRRLPSCRSTIR
jgi:hypothetical protein